MQSCPHATFLWTALPAWVGYQGNTENLSDLKRKQTDCEFVRGYRWFWSAERSLCRKHYGSWASQETSADGALQPRWWLMGRNSPPSERQQWGKGDQAKMTHRGAKPPEQGCPGSLLTHLTPAAATTVSEESDCTTGGKPSLDVAVKPAAA